MSELTLAEQPLDIIKQLTVRPTSMRWNTPTAVYRCTGLYQRNPNTPSLIIPYLGSQLTIVFMIYYWLILFSIEFSVCKILENWGKKPTLQTKFKNYAVAGPCTTQTTKTEEKPPETYKIQERKEKKISVSGNLNNIKQKQHWARKSIIMYDRWFLKKGQAERKWPTQNYDGPVSVLVCTVIGCVGVTVLCVSVCECVGWGVWVWLGKACENELMVEACIWYFHENNTVKLVCS